MKFNILITLLTITGAIYSTSHSQSALFNSLARYNANQQINLPLMELKDSVGLSPKFLSTLKELFLTETFIETGTFKGGTTVEAARHFKTVHTVELFPQLFDAAQITFKNIPEISSHFGESPQMLATVIPTLTESPILWLDAHYSGDGTALGLKETPIMEELKVIKDSGLQDAIILIDDCRYFYRDHEIYPKLTTLAQMILDINPSYTFALLGDALLAFPKTHTMNVSPIVEAITLSRFYAENPSETEDITKTDLIIAQASDEELAALKSLYEWLSADEKEGRHLGLFHWWYGLCLYQNKNYEEAQNAIKIAAKSPNVKQHLEKHIISLIDIN